MSQADAPLTIGPCILQVDAIGKPPERGSKPVEKRRSASRKKSKSEPQVHEGSLHEVSEVYRKFMTDPVLDSHATLWKNRALETYYEDSFAMLEKTARRQAESQDDDHHTRQTSISEVQISIMVCLPIQDTRRSRKTLDLLGADRYFV